MITRDDFCSACHISNFGHLRCQIHRAPLEAFNASQRALAVFIDKMIPKPYSTVNPNGFRSQVYDG